ncbi:hypothetical protein PoB_003495900 [Plakobranchus ocellatus]|uniref:EGF-like domain-containing protein n=1 Tax=Plakobranchus ocellatus TaxID=259542 RepID=A0AAV4AQ59_9GAST|nr:hypothetical protein PoB_003495900 [Plakobranchus ocellatus]
MERRSSSRNIFQTLDFFVTEGSDIEEEFDNSDLDPDYIESGISKRSKSTECATGTYGLNCSQACSTNCSAQLCNPITGECQLCVPHKKGKFCESECLECTDKCNPECEYGFCNHSNGTCELCQPGMYGQDCDQDCPASRWGPSCIHQCSRDCFSLSCRPKTGECSYCAEGIDKNYCDLECEDGQYGIGCKKTCSTYCFYGSKTCSHVDGECTKGCVAGFSPPLCVDECPNRTYGINCSQACSYNCFRQECDKKTGACIKCPPGRVGKQCEPGCQSGYFGDQCKQACSPNCFNSTCHDETGYCNLCPPGKTGDYCDIDNVFKSPTILSPSKESSGTWDTGSTIALVEAFVIAAFIISIIVIFIKRKTNFQFSNSTVKMSLLSTEENL